MIYRREKGYGRAMHSNDLTRATWRKSTYSGNSGNCVDVAVTELGVVVRDSKGPETGMLVVSRGEWRAFLATIKG